MTDQRREEEIRTLNELTALTGQNEDNIGLLLRSGDTQNEKQEGAHIAMSHKLLIRFACVFCFLFNRC